MPEYICKICNFKTRYRKPASPVHMRSHTGERTYRCPHCQKAFKSAWSTHHAHQNPHWRETFSLHSLAGKLLVSSSNSPTSTSEPTLERKPYCCTVCGKAFSRSGNRKRHMKVQHPTVTDEVSTTTGSHLLPDGTTATFTTHKFTTADTVTEVSQVRSPTGKAIVTTVESPSAFLTTVSQDSQPTVTTIENEDSSGLLLLADAG